MIGVLSDPIYIADGFNNFFTKIGSDLAHNIQKTDNDTCSQINGRYSPLPNLDHPTTQEVRDIIFSLKNSAPGHDGIKSILLKETIDHIIQPLTHVISLSFQSGIIPQALKIAKVIPIFKSGDTKVFSNYRPISILPCISKIFEKLVYERLNKHLIVNNIIYKHQYGFRKKYSTEHALIQLVNYISKALDNKKFALGVFLDLSKAFDTVSHDILISKLNRYGVEGTALVWFRNYFINREQFVYLNGFFSKTSKISFGVPQGSILGPLLFLIYINDLFLCCDHFLPILFADDTNLIAVHEDFVTLIQHVNDELKILSNWFRTNKLTLNVKKCNFMIFHNINKFYPKEHACIEIDGAPVTQVASTKFLGVLIDEGLTWSKHVDLVCTRSSKMLNILRIVLPSIHSSAHLTLYYSFLFPFMNYCNVVWGATSPTYLAKIVKIQKKFLRMISYSSKYAPSAPLFLRYKILSIEKVNVYLSCIFIHKFIHKINE